MKNVMLLFSMLLALTFTACSDDDNNSPDGDPTPPENENILNGMITENRTLDPSVDYHLTGILSVESGAKLTIPAGTHISTNTGTDVYIAVQQGGKINIQGTSAKPVIMEPSETGTWGGLLLLGKAETTAGANAIAEVGQLVYGGTDNSDSSGSIQYLIIRDSGAQINPESQYNGLTLYAVGSGTIIENVAIIGGADDGIEFFGGTVNVSKVYVENLEDDAIDWTEGWNGNLTNTYVIHNIADFSTAIEADGVNQNPNIINFTAVSTTGGTALQFKIESGATIAGLSLNGYETSIDFKDGGAVSNVQIEGQDSDPSQSYSNPATVNLADFGWAID
ncbi:MAG TPA: hypothetical protein VFM82_01825 [Flavobacteriaceae bacterium]|nr:hypothetical protein [Flavobacteriaceae bacterium]